MALLGVPLRDDLSPWRKTAVRTSATTMRPGWLAQAAFVFGAPPPKTFRAVYKGVGSTQRPGMKTKPSQLERDTAAYFENMSEEEAREDRELEAALCNSPTPDVDAPED